MMSIPWLDLDRGKNMAVGLFCLGCEYRLRGRRCRTNQEMVGNGNGRVKTPTCFKYAFNRKECIHKVVRWDDDGNDDDHHHERLRNQ